MSTLENLAALDLELREAKITLKKRIEEAFAKELGELEIRRDIAAYRAREEGVPVTKIAKEGMHTSATITAYRAIENGERYVKPAEATAAPTPFERYESGAIRFTPNDADLAPVLERLGLDVADAPASAEFTVENGVVTPTPGTAAETAGVHPVVAMVMADGSPHARALIEFAAQ